MTNKNFKLLNAFTLAEVLITLGIIGVVAAVTMPMLVTNIQERVRKEQVRTVKYKLTKATDKMNSLGKIKQYDTTMDFVNELKKHMTITKICENNELDKCWPSSEINAYSGSGTTLTAYNPKNLTTGQSLKALALSTKNTQAVGIVTGDGVPMLMVYSPSTSCNEFDEAKTYTWSVEDGKPVTNATTNCISAIFDINGAKGPNKIGQDVRTFNSLFGSTNLGTSYDAVGIDDCNNLKKKYGIKYCTLNSDYWVGAIAVCDKLGLHLPDIQTLANIANSKFGTNIIGPYTHVFSTDYVDCRQSMLDMGWGNSYSEDTDNLICGVTIFSDVASSVGDSFNGSYWSNYEFSERIAFFRDINERRSNLIRHLPRSLHGGVNNSKSILCVGD